MNNKTITEFGTRIIWRIMEIEEGALRLDLIGSSSIFIIDLFGSLNVVPNRPGFAASHSRGTKPLCLGTKVALGQAKQKTYIIWNDNFLCLSCLSATFALQHGGLYTTWMARCKGPLHWYSLACEQQRSDDRKYVCCSQANIPIIYVAFTFKWCGNSSNKTCYSQRAWIGYNIELAE